MTRTIDRSKGRASARPSARAVHPRSRPVPQSSSRGSRSPQRSGQVRRHSARTSPRTAHGDISLRRRLALLCVVLVAVSAGLVWKLADLQLRNADAYVEIGRNQRFRPITLAGGRGDIVDRSGNALAISLPSASFFTDPTKVEDPIGDAVRLAPLLGRNVDDVRELLAGEGQFAWLARQTSDAQAAELRALDIPGVFETIEPRRFHPAGSSLARPVIGNVDIDSSGQSGIEHIENERLTGQSGELLIELGQNGSRIPGSPELLSPAQPGADIVLSLDRSLQFEVERVLTRQVRDMGAKGGVVVVSKPDTGEILAMASVSRNDAGDVVVPSLNMASSWSFEPGSVMKAMTFAAVLDAGVASSSSSLSVADSMELYDRQFTDSSPHPVKEMTVTDIMTESSNVGTVMWSQELGGQRLDAYLRSFGFGSSPKMGFPGEVDGIMAEPEIWGGVGTAATSLGQGMTTTPLQLLTAYNVIANDGRLVPMQIVNEIVRADGTVEVTPTVEGRPVVTAEAAADVRAMLENVVAVGTGTNAQVDGYRVAGKTGTAWKPIEGGQGYQDGAGNYRYVSSFVGFLPADQPEISILVTIDEPTAASYASTVAAPVFADIASYSMRHFRIAPESGSLGVTPPSEVDVVGRVEERVVGQAATDQPGATPSQDVDVAAVAEPIVAETVMPNAPIPDATAANTTVSGVAVSSAADSDASAGVDESAQDSSQTGGG